MKTYRWFTLPKDLLEQLDTPKTSRSAMIEKCIFYAAREPHCLDRALSRRIQQQQGDTLADRKGSRQSSLSLEPKASRSLDEMAHLTGLPLEHVLWLAMEAYIYKL